MKKVLGIATASAALLTALVQCGAKPCAVPRQTPTPVVPGKDPVINAVLAMQSAYECCDKDAIARLYASDATISIEDDRQNPYDVKGLRASLGALCQMLGKSKPEMRIGRIVRKGKSVAFFEWAIRMCGQTWRGADALSFDENTGLIKENHQYQRAAPGEALPPLELQSYEADPDDKKVMKVIEDLWPWSRPQCKEAHGFPLVDPARYPETERTADEVNGETRDWNSANPADAGCRILCLSQTVSRAIGTIGHRPGIIAAEVSIFSKGSGEDARPTTRTGVKKVRDGVPVPALVFDELDGVTLTRQTIYWSPDSIFDLPKPPALPTACPPTSNTTSSAPGSSSGPASSESARSAADTSKSAAPTSSPGPSVAAPPAAKPPTRGNRGKTTGTPKGTGGN